METKAKIRRDFYVHGKGIKQIARERKMAWNTVRTILRSDDPGSEYHRSQQPRPQLGGYEEQLVAWLEADAKLPRKQRRTAMRLHEQLRDLGYQGAYDSVQRYVKQWKSKSGRVMGKAFVPLSFDPGDAMQFDWSLEHVEIGGVAQQLKVAHFRLCHSRKMFLVAFPREQLEMVLEAHRRAFEWFGGVPKRIIYGNPKTIVHRILAGKERDLNKRFLRMASHYLFEPVMCNPASGWEKGQVEKQVQDVRAWVFTPKLRFDSLDDLNAHLQAECERLSDRTHPEFRGRSIADVFSDEQPCLIGIRRPYEAYTEHECKASLTSLVRYDRHHYSVESSAAGRAVTLRAWADRIQVLCDGKLVAEHKRAFKRGGVSYEPWHYLGILEKKPGALRDGAPFKQWVLPAPLQRIRRKLEGLDGGDKAFVSLLCAVRDFGIEAVAAACADALAEGVIQTEWILNRLSRTAAQTVLEQISVADSLALNEEPEADCQRYDTLLIHVGVSNAIH